MKTDVVVIGSGAGGGPLAFALSQAGFDVLVLEKGREYSRESYPTDEVSSLWRDAFFAPLSEEPHILVHADLAAPRPSHLGWTASCVGGGTSHMGAYLSRLHPDDFRMRSRFGEYEALADWPYGYDELEPYYVRAEWEVGVSGAAGTNPFEGRRSKAYPMPPLDAHPLAAVLDRAAEKLGLHPYPTPRGVNSRPYQGRPACAYCDTCSGYGCRVGARGSTQEALLPRACRTGRCRLRARAMVREVTLSRDGRARGCVFIDQETGQEHEVRAKVVCVCCSAVESARLLLLSKSSAFPEGLANGSGLVGRHLQFHATSLGYGTLKQRQVPEELQREASPFMGRSLMDYYFLPEGVSDLAKGGTILFQDFSRNPILAAKMLSQLGENATVWGDELLRRLKEFYGNAHVVSFEVQQDFVPNDGTYVELDPEVRDKWGLPVARIHLHDLEHHATAARWLLERGLEVLEQMGCDDYGPIVAGETAPYLVHGTCRSGRDPATSVLNELCQSWEVPNLFVVDGSFMPTSGGVPPTLTILANSFRTAGHIIDRAGRGGLG